ncbi:helix-turn-helix domain-containing protein [Deinococcus sp. PESE-13]
MSTVAVSWAYKQKIKPSGQKFVLVALAEYGDSSGVCRVTQPELAAMTGQEERAVRNHLKALEEAGYIERAYASDEHGYRDADVITLQAPWPKGKRRPKKPRGSRSPAAFGQAAEFAGSETAPLQAPVAAQTDSVQDQAAKNAGSEIQAAKFAGSTGIQPANFAGQEKIFIPIGTKIFSNNNNMGDDVRRGGGAVGAGGVANAQTQNPQAPDGAAPDGARADRPSLTGAPRAAGGELGEPGHHKPAVPAPGAARRGPADPALAATWGLWCAARHLDQDPVARELQLEEWDGWAAAGLSADLQRQARDILTAGNTIAHPANNLRSRMQRIAREAEQAANAQRETRHARSAALCQPGERRTDPQGLTWTVEECAYGDVHFEEAHAPHGTPDTVVASWPLEGVPA